jgi:ABC-type branched-subunit amino acid transport system substrate-binding protein
MKQKLNSLCRTLVMMSCSLWAASAAVCTAASAPVAPIVIGVSYAESGIVNRQSRIMAGARAYVERINAAGGVQGRPLSIVAMDDMGNPERLASNMRTLAKEHNAVAFMSCLTDATCKTMAAVASELKIPLVGAMSGMTALSRQKAPYVFRVRADYATEAEVIAKQMVQMGQSRIAMLNDGSNSTELDALLRAAMTRRSIVFEQIQFNPSSPDSRLEAVKKLSGNYHAVVMNVSPQTVEDLIDQSLSDQPEWPRVLLTTASGNLSAMLGHFKGRAIGFSMVVPNPEIQANPLAREIIQDSEKYTSPLAITFDGMEAYISMRLIVEALKQTGRNISPASLFNVLTTVDEWNLNGFRISFRKDRLTGSDWVEMGFRSRQGFLVN